MRLILNVIWLVLCGLWMALGYVVAGIICCILIVTIPFGLASFRIAAYALWPFGRTVVDRRDAGAASTIGNVIWFIFAGLWLAIGHVLTGVALCITIIGIPLGVANFKMIPVSLMPLGKEIVELP
ncbi:YccF domain-containing protein [Amycolatopsis sp. NPDC058340]|uniref:YccF domain-containing protein n=1 Tax=Amycolatopsis sp. NPDC058340 TaxID=3346453 RepID=UPI003660FAB7